jgi:serine protease Do
MRLLCALLWLQLLTCCGLSRADDRNRLAAFQERVKEIAARSENSVVCIYVSRSEAYTTAPFWGVQQRTEHAGQLGRFDAAAAIQRVPMDAPNRQRLLRQIAEHDLSRPEVVPESYGSGFVLDKAGLILTNAHVIRNATKLYVRFPDGKGSWADIHASDPRSDLAVLQLLDPPAGLRPLLLTEENEVRTGQLVLSLVNAFEPGFRDARPTLGYGLVSAVRQRIPGNIEEMDRSRVTLHHYGTLIQTDARTSSGCSGGVLLDLEGRVVGMTTALAGVRGDRPGSSAIPFDRYTRRIVEVLRRGEEVEYGFLGVMLRSGIGFGERGDGIWLDRITPGSPAYRGGLMPGDKIVAINGEPALRNDHLFLYIGMTLAGNTARIQINRGGRLLTREITLAKYHVGNKVIASKRPPARFGLRVDYTSILAQRNPFLGFSRTPSDGVIISEVIPDSPADKARLQPDKVITHVNGQPVNNPAEYYKQIARSGKTVELTFLTSEGRSEVLTLEEK